MQNLTPKQLDSFPVENGFRLRGLEMTRIEVFVDAAFAFAVTLLVISFDEIPGSFEEMVVALKGVPAFIVSAAQLIWIWYEHNKWSRRYGLEDGMTTVLSGALLIVVLVYIYPLRVMIEGMFTWFSGGYLPATMSMSSFEELGFMFVFFGIGFTVLSLVFLLMYWHAVRCKEQLALNPVELFQSRMLFMLWLGFAVIGGVAIALALLVPTALMPWAGFAYVLLSMWGLTVHTYSNLHKPVGS
ncbi:MAG: TMEM175 family protein [Congregibacter sp.]